MTATEPNATQTAADTPADKPPPTAPAEAAKTDETPAAEAVEVADAPSPEDKTAGLAADVMRQRDVKQLAALVREKKAVEAEKAKLKESEPDLALLRQAKQAAEDGDYLRAQELFLAATVGEDRVKDVLAPLYDSLTSKLLGVDSKAQPTPIVDRKLDRIDKRVSAAEQRAAAAEAKLAEREAQEYERAVQQAVSHIGSFLAQAETEFPYLMAEADQPDEVVWGILSEAKERGVDLTLGDAAKLANDHFQPTFEKKKTRYQKHLSAPDKATDTPSKPETAKSPNGTSRKSVTNADASQVTPSKEPPKPRTDAERLDLAYARLKAGNHATD